MPGGVGRGGGGVVVCFFGPGYSELSPFGDTGEPRLLPKAEEERREGDSRAGVVVWLFPL